LCELATTNRPVQRKGWKNWFLLAVSIFAAGVLILVKTVLLKTMLATGTTGPIPYVVNFLYPTAVVVVAVTLSLRSSRYLPGPFLASVGVVATTLVPSFVQVMRTPATYEGTLPLYVPLAVFMLLPIAVIGSAVVNFVASKLRGPSVGVAASGVEPVKESEVEPVRESDVEPDTAADTETHDEPDAELDDETDEEPDDDLNNEPDTETVAEPHDAADMEPDTAVDTELGNEPASAADTELDDKPDAESHNEADVEPGNEPHDAADTETRPNN